jgi:hypothetical protein
MADPTNYNDPWEPHWLPDTHPDDRAAIEATFAGIHPNDLIPHDMPSHLASGLGLPESLVPQPAQEPTDPNGWNPAFTAEPPIAAPSSPEFVPMQPGTGLPAQVVDQAAAPPQLGALMNSENPNAIGSIHTETNAERYSGDPLANPVESERDQAAADMAMRDPVAFAQLEASHKLAADNHLAAQLIRASEDDRWAAEQNWKNRQEAEAKTAAAMADLTAQTTALMNRKIDPDRMMRNRSTYTKFVDMIGAIAGGIVVGQSGGNGPNRYLEGLQHQIDQDIDAQKSDIENGRQGINTKRSILAEEYARTGNLYQSAEAVRIAAKTAARDQILTQQQLYDPNGTRFFTLGKAAADMSAHIAAGQQALADKHLDQEIKIGDHNLRVAAELRAQRADAEKAKHDAALLALKKGGSGGGSGVIDPQDVIHQPGDFAALNVGPVPPTAMSFNGYNNWLKTKKLGAEVTGGASTLSKEEIEHAVPGIVTLSGKPMLANGEATNAVRLSTQVAATKTLVRLMDEVRAMRTGWTSDTVKSPEWQKLKANWAAAVGVAKDVLGLGALSGPDMDLVGQFLGAPDPTRVIGIESGVAKARENIINMTRDALDGASLHGKVKFDIPYIKPEPPKPTASDVKQTAALSRPSATKVLDTATDDRDSIIPNAMMGKQSTPRPIADIAGEYEKGAIDHIRALTAVLNGDNPDERDKAEAMLGELSGSPQASDTVRAAAQSAITTYRIMNAAGADTTTPVRSVAHEEAPPRPATAPNKKGHK